MRRTLNLCIHSDLWLIGLSLLHSIFCTLKWRSRMGFWLNLWCLNWLYHFWSSIVCLQHLQVLLSEKWNWLSASRIVTKLHQCIAQHLDLGLKLLIFVLQHVDLDLG